MRTATSILFASAVVLPVLAAMAQPATLPTTRVATTRVAATRWSTTQPATRPATKPDPLATPVSAVEHFFRLIKAEDFVGLRDMNLQPTTAGEMREKYAPIVRDIHAGIRFSVVDTHTSGPVALAICKGVTASDQTKAVFTVLLFKRFDRWKVEFGQPNMRRLTQGEKDSLGKVAEWENKRVKELREKLIDKPSP